MEFSQPRVGVGVVIRRGEQVLLGRRRGSHGAGHWALPGGRVEPGEDADVTAARETHEETGLRVAVRPLGFWTTDLFPVEGQHWVTLYYVADAGDQEPQLLEPHKCDGWQWFSWDALPSPLFSGAMKLRNRSPQLSSL